MTESNIKNNGTPIPRDWQISNPVPIYKPNYDRGKETFNFELFKLYNQFVNEQLPLFELNVNVIPSTTCQFLQNALDIDCDTPFLYQMLIRAFLLACQREMLHILSHPSLTKSTLLHNELYLCAELIKKRSLSPEMVNFCDMLIADVLDLYHSTFSDIIDNRFWAKTKSGEDVIEQFLKKEVERLRLLSPYTFNMVGSVIIRKAVESAPPNSVEILKKWGTENNLPYDSC
ncbi:hypothetical protein M9Y10_011370 [Tritrichomonas musculus]|uniref:Uncharacterized protein n=1 Tax=Tritrichomonas musculus TaxID=1915356 RepID=A0ABR2IJ80_9EUKA